MSLKIFDGGNIKNYVIINKNQKEKTDLLGPVVASSEGSTRLTDNFEKNTHLEDNNSDNHHNNKNVINSERVEITKNNRPKRYKRKNQLKKENEDFLNLLKSGSGFKIIPKQ